MNNYKKDQIDKKSCHVIQDTIEESFMSTMKTLMDAPETSPLAMVNMDDIGLFYLQLTR